MTGTNELLDVIHTALDPERFFEETNQSTEARSLLIGS